MSTQDPLDAEDRLPAAPPIEAATAANQTLLRRIMGAGENDFSASPYLRPGRGNPVYALLGQGLDADSVPAPGQRVPLHAVANIGAGGESVDVTDAVHPAWADIAVRARQTLFDPLHAGLDLIAHDIALPPDAQTWAMIELNTNPDLGLHHFPMHGPGRDVASAILDAWFAPRHPPALALRVIISGTVHNVGYRRWLWREAHLRTVQGWTRNHPDGTVEAILHGPEPAVRDLVAKCHQGPARAHVTDVACEAWAGEPPPGFTLRQPPKLQ